MDFVLGARQQTRSLYWLSSGQGHGRFFFFFGPHDVSGAGLLSKCRTDVGVLHANIRPFSLIPSVV